jgi:flavin reductase ActVB
MQADEFKAALKDFASGVTIVTTADLAGRPLGATVSSFTSLSLEPPLVLVCLKEESQTVRAVRQRQAFVVHILERTQAALARTFATDNAEKFADAIYTCNQAGVPCLDGCPSLLECRLEAEVRGGDHIILIGLVEAARPSTHFEPLVYAQRDFYALGSLVSSA